MPSRAAFHHALAVAALALGGLPTPSLAAEFAAGVEAHARGDYGAARGVFLDLAALGDGPSQYNLGAMALRGEGAPKDRGEAAGWMLAARENGHDPTPRALDALVASLTADERAASGRVLEKFGRGALEAAVLPGRAIHERPSDPSHRLQAPHLISGPPMEYPRGLDPRGPRQALVVARVTLGEDGRPRDPEVLLSVPAASEGGAPFVTALLRGLLGRRYEPARQDGRPVAVFYNVRATFRLADVTPAGASVLARDRLDGARAGAAQGDPRAQYVAGVLEIASGEGCDPERGCVASWALVLSAAQAGVPDAQLFIGRSLLARHRAKALAWLERASSAGLPTAHVAYGLALLAEPEPPYERVRALLERAGSADEPSAIRRALAVLACSPEPRLRSPQAASAIAKRLRLDDEADPLTFEAAAAAHASVGDFGRARRAQKKALRLATKLGWEVRAMEERLDGYGAGRACSQDLVPRSVADLSGSPG